MHVRAVTWNPVSRDLRVSVGFRGQLRAYSGDLKEATKICPLLKNGRKGSSPGVLKRNLQIHAGLLNRLNRPEEAQAKLDEAAKL